MKTVFNSEFHKERRRVEKEINKPFGDIEKIWFIDASDDKTINMGLNIAATGKLNILEAEIYAEAITNAVHLAKNFKYNGYIIDYMEEE